MKTKSMKKIWIGLSVLVLAALACQFGGGQEVTTPIPPTEPPVTPSTDTLDRTHLLLSTVQVMMEAEQGSEFVTIGSGSGTIISADGLILTNAHVASPASQGERSGEPDRLTIAIVQAEDQPPVLSYVAKVLAVDGTLDLAVLRIDSTLNGSTVNPSELNLPYVPLGNSDEVRIGDHLNIFGFPGVGFDTITFTEGSVAGFVAEEPPGNRAWIKTAANVAHGNSGGLAANEQGQIIAIPTAVLGDCDQADTNGDGQIDMCIPNGNAINFLRPINWAVPMIEAAQAGKEYVTSFPPPDVATEAGSGEEAATNFVWLDTSNSSASECNWSDKIVNAYPDTALCIVAGLEYSGMTDGQPVRELWYLNAGDKPDEFTYSWEHGAEGLFATQLGNNGEAMPAGEWSVEIYAGEANRLIGTSDKVVVGDGTSSEEPSQPAQEDTITIYGTVYDVDTNKPISAYVYILLPGVTFEQWQNQDFPDSSLAAGIQTDNSGKYEISGIPRETSFTIVFFAEGYRIQYEDNVKANADTPDRVQLDIGLTK